MVAFVRIFISLVFFSLLNCAVWAQNSQDSHFLLASPEGSSDTNWENKIRFFKIHPGISINGQVTFINQSSNLSAHKGDKNLTISGDLFVEKSLGPGLFHIDLQFAKGQGIDSSMQGGAMVNNDVMEDPAVPKSLYFAKFFYHADFQVNKSSAFTFDIGKFGVNDFFDQGLYTSDQTMQFLNQAVNNNGAFDYVQDLQGHGYTYGLSGGYTYKDILINAGLFSSDNNLSNISKKSSTVLGLAWTPHTQGKDDNFYQIYTFINRGEYGAFNKDGSFISRDAGRINRPDNRDNLTKRGWGLNINHSFAAGVNFFAKYGAQDSNRDVRHYQDMDRSILTGMVFNGDFWGREMDSFGVAYEIGQLKGNHRLAHELGYSSFFDRSAGIGRGNYADEKVLETYYRFAVDEFFHISFDYQNIASFNYNNNSPSAHFFATRVHARF